jgi:hypothetical protein
MKLLVDLTVIVMKKSNLNYNDILKGNRLNHLFCFILIACLFVPLLSLSVKAAPSGVTVSCPPKVVCFPDGGQQSIAATDHTEMNGLYETSPWIAAYMTTDYLENLENNYGIWVADAVRVTVSFAGTDSSVIQSDNFLMAGIAAQGQDHVYSGYEAVDWGYIFALQLEHDATEPYLHGEVIKVHEYQGYTESMASCMFSFDQMTINSQVTLKMTWTPDSLEYDAIIDGMNFHVWSYAPESSATHTFYAGTQQREIWDVPVDGTVKFLQFFTYSDYNIDADGILNWQVHLKDAALIPTGTTLWKYVPFAYLTHGDQANFDNMFRWGGEQYTGVDIYHCNRHVDFYDALGAYVLPQDTFIWYLLVGDVDGSSVVNILDAILLANAFSSSSSSPNWNPDADINTDGVVDIYDALLLATHYGEQECFGCGGVGESMDSGQPPNGQLTTMEGVANTFIDPSQLTIFKNENFTVNVRLDNTEDLAGWEFKLYWNRTILNCTAAIVQTPIEWQGNEMIFGAGIDNDYNSTHGLYFMGETAAYPAPPVNGSMTLATLTFQALQMGTTSLTLTEVTLGDRMAQGIDSTVSSGSVTVYYGRYMRSDTKNVNGLNAYLLNATETTSYQDAGNANSGRNAYWGIRAWIRHANGVEQEITLDGQTGTPKAVVVRGSGSGMLSATTSVSQAALQTTDSLVVRVYFKTSGSSWVEVATFTTEQLGGTTLTGCSWTVYYYTWAQYYKEGGYTAGHFYWGSPARNSRIQNLQYS